MTFLKTLSLFLVTIGVAHAELPVVDCKASFSQLPEKVQAVATKTITGVQADRYLHFGLVNNRYVNKKSAILMFRSTSDYLDIPDFKIPKGTPLLLYRKAFTVSPTREYGEHSELDLFIKVGEIGTFFWLGMGTFEPDVFTIADVQEILRQIGMRALLRCR